MRYWLRTHAGARRAVDVQVLQQQVLGGVDGHRPELALHEADTLEDGVCRIADDEIDRSTGHIRHSVSIVVPAKTRVQYRFAEVPAGGDMISPDLTVSVKRPIAIAGEQYIVAAKLPSKGLVLITQWQTMVRPICYVGSPLSPA